MLKHCQLDFFELESGRKLNQANIAYQTYGTLNKAKDNVIWVCHALTASADLESWWSGLFGAGNIFDPEKYFIVCANNLGSHYGSTSAKSIDPESGLRYGLDFPFFTIRDSARFHLELMHALEISGIHLLIGGSCGGNIALEMSYELEQKVNRQVLLCSSAKESPWSIGIHESQRMILESDPEFKVNQDFTATTAIKNCRALAMPFYRNQVNFSARQQETDHEKLDNFRASSYLRHQGEKFAKRFDAHCYYTLLNALDTHNIARGRGTIENILSEIQVPTMCIALNTDIFIPPVEQQFLATHLSNGIFKEIDSNYGHDGFLIEFEQIADAIRSFL